MSRCWYQSLHSNFTTIKQAFRPPPGLLPGFPCQSMPVSALHVLEQLDKYSRLRLCILVVRSVYAGWTCLHTTCADTSFSVGFFKRIGLCKVEALASAGGRRDAFPRFCDSRFVILGFAPFQLIHLSTSLSLPAALPGTLGSLYDMVWGDTKSKEIASLKLTNILHLKKWHPKRKIIFHSKHQFSAMLLSGRVQVHGE